MSIFTIIIAIALVGVTLWAINAFLPMEAKVKTILNWVVIGALILWLLNGLGVLNYLKSITV